jgi:hypothetical protein
MSTFHYRRRLERKELMMLVGGAAGAGAALASGVFYLGRIWLQRVPLKPEQPTTGGPAGPGPDPALRAAAAPAGEKGALPQ